MSKWDKKNGLYAITPDGWPTLRLLPAVEEVLEAGVAFLQYRNKQLTATDRYDQAKTLLAMCRSRKVPLIVNDDPVLAHAIGADGVHLGREDNSWQMARDLLGQHAIIGVSCYGSSELASLAENTQMDYVAFGSIFASTTKPQATVLGIDQLTLLCKGTALPIVAIGGITADNVSAVYKAGASYAAVISALFDAPSLAAEVKKFSFPRGN